jgi:hypothetical protein
MDIQVAVSACHAVVVFTEPAVALEYMKMVMGLIKPAQFLSFIHAVATDPDAESTARAMIAACFGTPS